MKHDSKTRSVWMCSWAVTLAVFDGPSSGTLFTISFDVLL